MDAGKESMPNVPNLKWWNYDTTTKVNYNYKFDTSDPVQKPTRVNFDKTHYIMPQWEKVSRVKSKIIYSQSSNIYTSSFSNIILLI